jgi:hypothetical protein
LNDRGSISGCDRDFYHFSTYSKPALVPTQLPIQWVPGALFKGVEVEVKKIWNYTSTPPYVLMAWCIVKHGNNLVFR